MLLILMCYFFDRKTTNSIIIYLWGAILILDVLLRLDILGFDNVIILIGLLLNYL